MTGFTQGTLVLDNGYVRLKYFNSENSTFLIWPYGFSLKMEGGEIKIFDEKGREVAKMGDEMEMGGGDVPKSSAEGFIGRKLPDGIEGPFFIVGR